MKIVCTLCSIFLLALTATQAQNPGCDGIRYKNNVFTTVQKTTVTYAPSTNHFGQPVNLLVDIYEPVGDTLSARPVVVIAHGGSFILGDKSNMKANCERLAKQGYVAASIQYRLYPFFLLGFPDSIDVMDTAVKAVADMKAAVRFFRESADTDNPFRVDANNIFVGGYSAGAVTALHMAYMDPGDDIPSFLTTLINNNGGWTGNSGTASNQGYSSEVKAVLNMSGGIYRNYWLDSLGLPLVSIHGDADETVPYESGLAADIAYLEGSHLIHQRAEAVGIPNFLQTVPGGGHTNTYDNAAFAPMVDTFFMKATELMESLICQSTTGTHTASPSGASFSILPNPAGDDGFRLHFEDAGDYQVHIFDIQGRKVLEINHYQSDAPIVPQDGMAPGMYLIQVFGSNRQQPLIGRMLKL